MTQSFAPSSTSMPSARDPAQHSAARSRSRLRLLSQPFQQMPIASDLAWFPTRFRHFRGIFGSICTTVSHSTRSEHGNTIEQCDRLRSLENTAGVSVLWDLNKAVLTFGYDHYTYISTNDTFSYLDRNAEIVLQRLFRAQLHHRRRYRIHSSL
jgi:hypothetical protein